MNAAHQIAVVRTSSCAETERVAGAFAASLSGAAVVSLEGPLGAGKSVFARAVCAALGVEGPVTSPTYTLQNEYFGAGGRRILHLDCFRLEGPADFEDLGVEDFCDDDTVVLVEWGDKVLDALPVTIAAGVTPEMWRIEIDPQDGNERQIRIHPPIRRPPPPEHAA